MYKVVKLIVVIHNLHSVSARAGPYYGLGKVDKCLGPTKVRGSTKVSKEVVRGPTKVSKGVVRGPTKVSGELFFSPLPFLINRAYKIY